MQKVLSAAARNPNLIPSDFMAYLVDYIQTSRLSIPLGQVFGFTQSKVVSGNVDATGTPTAGAGFSVVRTQLGRYDLTFATPFSVSPAVIAVASVINWAFPLAAVVTPTVTGFTVWTMTGANTWVDSAWWFLAQPPS